MMRMILTFAVGAAVVAAVGAIVLWQQVLLTLAAIALAPVALAILYLIGEACIDLAGWIWQRVRR